MLLPPSRGRLTVNQGERGRSAAPPGGSEGEAMAPADNPGRQGRALRPVTRVIVALGLLLGGLAAVVPALAEQPLGIVRPPAVRVGPSSGMDRPGVIRPPAPRENLFYEAPSQSYEAPTYRYEAPQAIPDSNLDRRLPGSPKLPARCRSGYAAYDPATNTTLDEAGNRVPCT